MKLMTKLKKIPMKAPLKSTAKGVIGASNYLKLNKVQPAYTPNNPLLKIKAPAEVKLEVVKTVKPKSQAQQMADTLNSKNHKPSNGLGVGM